MSKEVLDIINDEFKRGHKLLSLHHYPKNGEVVELEIEREWLPYLHHQVHLLSPVLFHERQLVFLYIQELIELLPSLKKEGFIENRLLCVLETLLLAMDYLSQEKLTDAPYTAEHRHALNLMLKDCFEEFKTTGFSEDANRPILNKSELSAGLANVYALDKREERNRIYMAVIYKKPDSVMEHFKQVGHVIGNVRLKPNTSNISYAEAMEGKTDHGLHENLIYDLGRIQQTFAWLLNSTSWKQNELFPFDEMEIRCKLGL